MSYYIKAACGCNTGRRRSNNEDNFYFNRQYLPAENHALPEILTQKTALDQPFDFAVFDGMGGQADGQIASNIAASVFFDVHNKFESDDDSEVFLKYAVQKMTNAVWSKADEQFSNMGTTAAILHFTPREYYVCNVGDSRVFQFRNGHLAQISKDHTDEQFLNDHAVTSRKPSLTQYIGVSPEELTVVPYISSGALANQDEYLICSDGLTDMVNPASISTVLASSHPTEEKVAMLIQAALEAGGRDNVTVILIRVEEQHHASIETRDSGDMVLDELTSSLEPTTTENKGHETGKAHSNQMSAPGRDAVALEDTDTFNPPEDENQALAASDMQELFGEADGDRSFSGLGRIMSFFFIGVFVLFIAVFAIFQVTKPKKKAAQDSTVSSVSAQTEEEDAEEETSDVSYYSEDGMTYYIEEKTSSGLTVKSGFDAQTKDRKSTEVYDENGVLIASDTEDTQEEEDQKDVNPSNGQAESGKIETTVQDTDSPSEPTNTGTAPQSGQPGSNTITSPQTVTVEDDVKTVQGSNPE